MAADVIHEGEEAVAAGPSFKQHMPEYSDMCPVCGPRVAERRLRNQRVTALHRALKEFGYSSLTPQEVGEAYHRVMEGTPDEANVIDKLIRSQLVEAGVLKEA